MYQRSSFASVWRLAQSVYHPPSMKMGQIINISHRIPPGSPFHSYEEFQMHWKNLYGYVLPENTEGREIYLSVYFKPIGERLFTYPLRCIRSQPVQYFPRTDLESVLNSFISDAKAKFSHLCGFPVRMSSKALYATQELSRTPVCEIQSESMKLAGEMVCVVSLTQTPPRKQALASISSSRSKENSHWMEHLIKEPKPHNFSSSQKSAEEISVEATEKLISKQIPGISELPLWKSLGVPGSSAFKHPPKKISKIIPIFKGRLTQMNGNTTNQTDGKGRKNVERQSPVKCVKSSMLTVCKSSLAGVYKPATHSSSFQIITEKACIKQDVSVFQWKTESSGQMINSDSSSNSAAGWSSCEVSHNKVNSPSLHKNVRSVLQKSGISPKLNTFASSTSNSRVGKNFASQNTIQVLRKQCQSKKVHLQNCKLENEVRNSSLLQRQTKKSNEGRGLNIHESILNDTVCIAKNDESKASYRSKNCIAKTTCLPSNSVCEQTCDEAVTSNLIHSTKESNREASVKKGSARKRQASKRPLTHLRISELCDLYSVYVMSLLPVLDEKLKVKYIQSSESICHHLSQTVQVNNPQMVLEIQLIVWNSLITLCLSKHLLTCLIAVPSYFEVSSLYFYVIIIFNDPIICYIICISLFQQ
ncbi:uncharacterized protein C18orf63 homolog isoform X3 [Lagopus muta]|uniref:uncharacterized protein C18orf63 homolog isoform X3 n=1 Tax=Lagopus muta TaxID=64668 RepID=UPI0020A20AFF|nr:uncharacterized protein C18orf63 homolog isoform X3 [Lagopus muta]XP_048795248.1 uncharacterized protein C18orf63 homolog isoform X3 [Lagopus muta]